MKVSREQAAENRERVLDVASQLYREHGFDGVGVADIMKAAGLTHGAFYGQFSSKEELMVQASARALDNSHTQWRRLADTSPDDPVGAIGRSYLSTRHRDNPGLGCALPPLSADAARSSSSVRQTVTAGFRNLLDVLVSVMPDRTKAVKRDKALVTLASMVGAQVLARAVDDPALSKEILKAVLSSLQKKGVASSDQ